MGSSNDGHETDLEPRPEASAPSTELTRVFADAGLGHGRANSGPLQIISAQVRQRLFAQEPVAMRIGRFVVLEAVGHGGMGTVYSAYDEELDRKVAVKVLLEDDLPSEAVRARFRREAQALARLSHPNVVTIHEVGEAEEGRLFLAMEFIRGQSLASWFQTKPPWEEVLEAFMQAGRGLAAAHAAGMVHRDLKPLNLMRSDDGIVKVLDFGLARGTTDDVDDTHDAESLSSSSSALHSSLTRTGAIMGTPAYMSPEQHHGGTIDARSDQYSFCVALWEGLAGSRPLDRPSIAELHLAKLEGPPPWPTSAPSVPRRIVKAVQRGLSTDPADRWPSMEDLLAALATEPTRPRRWWLGLGLGGLGALAQRCSRTCTS